jgi:hypothetical protein
MTFTTNNPNNWTGGTIHTLYGDVINGAKYLQWSYNNNPGTLIADNNSIRLDAPIIQVGINPILLKDQFHGLAYGDSNATYDVNIDGPFLFGYSAGALGTTDPTNDIKLKWDRTTVSILKNLYMFSNDINDVKNIDFLSGNIATGSTYIDINGGGLGTDTSLKSGTTYYTIDTAGNPTVNALSTNQVTISQTAGSDFVLFNNGDTRMNAKKDAYVGGDRDVYVIAQQNMNIRAPHTQYITIQQTGAANDSFIQLSPSGSLEQFSRGDTTIRCLSTNNITLSHTGAGSQSYFQLSPPGNVVLNARTYFESIAPSGNYFTSPFTELRGYLTFNTANNYINNLRHIYGDIGGGGGGLAIDYMYGMFFNGTGRNANLYIDAGNLNMINYNSGLNLATYNSNGTGNFSLYSASNDMYIATGTGRDININGGRYVSVNAAQPGGTFGIYASTMNTTTLGDTNFNCGLNFSITGGGASQYVTFQNAGTSIQFAGANIYVGTSSGGFNFNIPVAIGSAYFLNMQGAPISNVVGIVGHPSSNLEIAANGARNLVFTGSNIQATASGTIDFTSYGDTNISTSFSNDIILNSDGNLSLQAARAGCNVSLYSPDVFITGTTNVIINTSYSTWTGSNNFNILGSNIGITSSNAFDIVATGSGLILDGEFKRKLSGTNISQPIIQYGEDNTGSGNTGSVVITLPVAYPLASSYVAFATMEDSSPSEISVVRNSASTIEIYWAQAGSGSHVIAWQTIGK